MPIPRSPRRAAALLASCATLVLACGDGAADPAADAVTTPSQSATAAEVATAGGRYDEPYKISLAQWSLHKRYLPPGVMGGTGAGDPYDFPADAKALGFDGVEYVSALYGADIEEGAEHGKSVTEVLSKLDARAKAAGVEEVLIMVDGEGELADLDDAERERAVERHKHWIDGAWASGIPTIRVNAGGESLRAVAARQTAHDQAVKSLRALGEYAAPRNVNVVVENHGGFSSDPAWLAGVMAAVGLPNVGILPDFGNFCRRRVNPTVWEEGCADEVPADSIYAAVGMWMPYAHAVSAKSYAFDADGNETAIDYARMLDTVRAHGYDGYVGVEFEGGELTEEEGIAATKALLERH